MIQHSTKLLNLHRQIPSSKNVAEKIISPQESTASSLPAKKNLLFKILRHPSCMPYIRYAVIITAINIFYFFKLLNGNPIFAHGISPGVITSFVLANFSIAILIRQQYVINLLFKIATSVPTSWPLSLRWAAGKVYHFGGIHVGGFFSGTLWLLILAIALFDSQVAQLNTIFNLLVAHLVILSVMIVASLPKIRAKSTVAASFTTFSSGGKVVFFACTKWCNAVFSSTIRA